MIEGAHKKTLISLPCVRFNALFSRLMVVHSRVPRRKHRVANNSAVTFLPCINYLEYVNRDLCVCVEAFYCEIYAHF